MMVTEALSGSGGGLKADGGPEGLGVSERAQNRESINQAIAAIKEGREHGTKLSVRNAAVKYGVSKSTLHRYLAKDEGKPLSESEGSGTEGRLEPERNVPDRQVSNEGEMLVVKFEPESNRMPKREKRPSEKPRMTEETTKKESAAQNAAPSTTPAAETEKKREGGSKKASTARKAKGESSGIATLLAASAVAIVRPPESQKLGQKRARPAEESVQASQAENEKVQAAAVTSDGEEKSSKSAKVVPMGASNKICIQRLEKDLGSLQSALRALQDRVKKLEEDNVKSKHIGLARA